MHRTIIIYLDSSDYSVLTNPKGQSVALDKIRLELIRFAESGLVNFVFSGAHLSEMAPLDSQYTQAATARAELLVALCGRKAFISFDRLIKFEIARLINPSLPPIEVLSNDGTWFPEMKDILSPVKWADIVRPAKNKIEESGLNRHQRRTLKRKLRQQKDELINHIDSNADLSQILEIYPMRPENGDVIKKYIIGKATVKDAENAFLESLRDPSWMMKWFAKHYDNLTHVTEWLRGPSRDMISKFKEIAEGAQKLYQYEKSLNPDHKSIFLTQKNWQIHQNDLLTSITKRLKQYFYPDSSDSIITGEQVDKYCPGFSTAIRSLHSSLWTSMGCTPRTPQESDYVDSMHAMYAPYVDLFRADRYMSTHIDKQVKHRGVKVVSRLQDLPTEINRLIESNN